MPKKQNKTSLVWFRNDLRINDNSTLVDAINNSETVIAIYCFEPRYFKENKSGFKITEKYRAKFLIETVTDLKQQLLNLGIPLYVYNANTEMCIAELESQYNFDALYLQKEWTKDENKVFQLVRNTWDKDFNIYHEYNQFLYHPDDLDFDIQKLPAVFTNFRKDVEKRCDIRPKNDILKIENKNTSVINNTVVPTLKDLGFEDFKQHPNSAFPLKGGETEALKHLNNYFFETKKLGVYKKTRNGLIGKDFSSKFSPWLANGSLSAKTIYWKVKEFETLHFKNQSTYWLIFELIWRDYFKYISMKHGGKIFKIGGILDKDYTWNTYQKDINKWINGETNEPFVNANMIELKKTGWMSNRGRQNVASYFAKTLKLDWRIGAAYFESMLIDYDVHSNYGNWMYVAGVGNDPRDRTFNVKLQAERYDNAGKYQRLWLQDAMF
ncbi:DASH family cryptochrome [Lacinutrix jangbogonensis]|uniref:DASH family cryptochrome n=1 Tax=Lacinutrix jangbogonensis TaxID=1469557 RepID=UPI00053DEE5C|nr:DASH family cryptochrome [Lacinutrix jangbogonensis]